MSCSESLYNADSDSYGSQEYEIEDETAGKDAYECDISYGIEDEFLDNTDEFTYADEYLEDMMIWRKIKFT